MVNKKSKIHWDKQAAFDFNEAIRYIRKDSSQNADGVKKEILLKISGLLQQPEIYPPDKYKQNNPGTYRAFEIHSFRISYLIMEDRIIIVRLRHTGQEPKGY